MGGKLGAVAGVAGLAGLAAEKVLTAPITLANAYKGLVSAQQPYLDFRIGLAQMGRAGNFNSRDLEEMILPRGQGAAGYLKHLVPTQQRTAAMEQLGLGPLDIQRNIKSTRIAPRSATEAFDTAASIRRAYLAPGVGLPEQALGQALGQSRVLGMTKPGEENKFFGQLGQTMVASTREGLDHSRTSAVMLGLAQQQASNGALAPSSMSALSDFWSRMVSSGMPLMRSGEGVLNAAASIQNAAGTIGVTGDTPRTMITASYFNRRGGMPTDEEGLRKSLGVDKQTWNTAMSTPAAQQTLMDYQSAAKAHSPFAYDLIGTHSAKFAARDNVSYLQG